MLRKQMMLQHERHHTRVDIGQFCAAPKQHTEMTHDRETTTSSKLLATNVRQGCISLSFTSTVDNSFKMFKTRGFRL